MKVIKKDNSIEGFEAGKIIAAVKKAAFRCDKVIDADHLDYFKTMENLKYGKETFLNA